MILLNKFFKKKIVCIKDIDHKYFIFLNKTSEKKKLRYDDPLLINKRSTPIKARTNLRINKIHHTPKPILDPRNVNLRKSDDNGSSSEEYMSEKDSNSD